MNLTLIGMAGAGKSHWGRILAKHFNLELIDSDLLLVEKFHLPLQEILDQLGDEAFIRAEGEIIKEAIFLKENWVLAPGGSVIYGEQLMDFLKRKSLIIYLESNPNDILKRIKPTSRGIVGLKRLGSFEAVYKERQKLFEAAANLIFNLETQTEADLLKMISPPVISSSNSEN